MKNYRKTSDGKKGGLFVGKSHDKGGIPAIVVDTGQPIEVEGGEAIINKEATKKYWKELSKINQSAGNGNPIPPPQGFSDEVSQYSNGGKISKLAITEGTKHELEHRDTIAKFKKQGISDKEVARKIALDHLKENPNYYKVLKKLKLKKGGEIVCRSCGWSWLESENPIGENLYKCHKCNSDNKNFYKTGGAVENKKEVYDEWKTLVNMSASELKEFLKTEDGKEAGLTKEKADELGIGSGRESASWILKMKVVPYTEWSDTMWSWAKRQIGFIKRMSGNKGSLYQDNGNKTRKHTSLLIWGHNPEKFKGGGRTIAQTPAPKKDRIVGSEKNAPKSSESSKSAEKIVLSEQVLESIETILREYNKDTSKKVDLNTAKAVVRRGMGAYSSSHRPTISGGKPNSRVAWGLARLKAFLYKIENGESKSGKYSQDNDLIDDLGYEHQKFAKGNKINVENKDEYFDEMQSQVASTDDMIKLVANEREKKIKEWRKLEKVVVGRNDGYSWEDNTRNDNRKIALKPSRAKIIEIIKNNPNVTKIYFYGTIKAGQKVGEELEIVDDFAVVLWSKMESLFEKGFQFKTENGKYVNTIIDKNETFDYKNKKDNGDFVYYESIDKYGNIGQGRINVNVLKEDLENGFAVAINKTEVRKFAKGNKIKAENKGGNCYEMAGKMAMGIMFADKDMSYPDFKGTPYVVHAEVSGQGAISGLRYGHAWVEDDMFIYDFSNGRKIVFPKELYYALGNVITKPPKYYKYTFNEARKKMSETGHYGSWELKTESGL